MHTGKAFVLLPGAHSTFANEHWVIKLRKVNVARHAKLAGLIPEFVLPTMEPIKLEAPVVAGVDKSAKDHGVLMPYVADLKPITNFMPAADRFAMLLQVLAALTGALPHFGVMCIEGNGLGARFAMCESTLRLVLLNPLRLFTSDMPNLQAIAEMMAYVDRLTTCVPSDAVYNALSDIKRKIGRKPPAKQAAMLKALAATIAAEMPAVDAEQWVEAIGLALDAFIAQCAEKQA